MFLWRLTLRRIFDYLSKSNNAIKVMAVILAATVAVWFFVFGYADRPGPLEVQKNVVIPRGKNMMGIAEILEKNEVIRFKFLFPLAVYAFGKDSTLKAGEYIFEPHVTPRKVADMLVNQRAFFRKLVLPEGLTTHQMLELIKNMEGLDGEITSSLNEGALFPDTYYFSFGDTREFIIERIKQKHSKVMADLWPKRGVHIGGYIDNEDYALRLASIVEKETGIDGERGRVAAVFMNRLRKGMKLQSDPTVIYAITGGKGDLGRELTKDDLNFPSPYNTYVSDGLPPGPICNPGKESIEAVLNPPETDELYFVADGNGGHVFATNLRDHINNVNKYRALMKNGKN